MFIDPMQRIDSIESLNKVTPQKTGANIADIPFVGLFQNAVQNVIATETDSAQKMELLATGEIDDLHTIGIAAAKAQLSVELMVQMRNRLMDAYSEIMRMSV
ncbi:MAG: flagellar hook-basal body complex protein FliE [Oscillospiraceae bacterium]|nr:flagellar hook-basal body complex protein FliE [Oscillospiraceae bacterium]